ncbi:ClpXP protease specificity-enhancing factor [Pseudogulbenkiania ferrooxidans]|uniref:Stringent starvation protein B n=1 Tax=Pseudogulbenkiania ferrooxidans 2002 TaxID=279714 RepID=B9YZA5_9NEIS|nr:ClpXP protease specificity-enhancing factor [Pseudogulbenkiania ferrooxidans]EEG10458.1 Stringent starvation protein B [Pseudogulbenkiania ferrooxidans 2002]
MSSSTKPYLIRALHEWCTDNGHTPYIVVWVTDQTSVPREFVKNNEIVLNISPTACQALKIDNDWISFSARFGGVAREIWVPVANVMSIFARETGEGMGFEVEAPPAEEDVSESAPALKPVEGPGEGTVSEAEPAPRPSGRPSLRVVK